MLSQLKNLLIQPVHVTTLTNYPNHVLSAEVKGIMSQGFHNFLVLTVLKLVVGNFTHERHYL